MIIEIPRIYVTCLAAYNNGKLHGRWIDATQSVDDIHAEISEMLRESPEAGAEEWAIHDHEGFGEIDAEYTDLETLQRVASLIQEHGELAAKVIAHHGIKYLDNAEQSLRDNYCGEYDSLEDFAYSLAKDTGDVTAIPERFQNYIDWEAIGRDYELGGDVYTVEVGHKVHVFWNR